MEPPAIAGHAAGRDGREPARRRASHRTRRAAGLAGLLALALVIGLVLSAGAGSASAAAPLSWSAPTLIDPPLPAPELAAVSCPSASLCVAVDRYGGVVSSTDPAGGASAWQFAQVGGEYSRREGCDEVPLCMLGISCPSTSLCVAVGANGRVLVSSDPTGGAGAWSQSEVDEGRALTAVSCPSTSLCVAVDRAGNVLTSTDPGGGAGAWSAAQRIEGEERPLFAVSCASSSLCMVVGEGHGAFVSANPTGGAGAWSREAIDEGSSLTGISCPSQSLCVAVDQGGGVLTSTEPAVATSWSRAEVVEHAIMNNVSCGSESLCVAFDKFGDALTSTDPTGGAGAWTKIRVEHESSLVGIGLSCAAAGPCVAADGSDLIASSAPTGGVWSMAWVDPNDPIPLALDDVACPAASLCVAVDNARQVLTSTDPAAGAWGVTGRLLASPWGVACASVSLCVAGSAFAMIASVEPTAEGSWYATEEDALPIWPRPAHWAPHLRASCPSVSLCVAVEAEGQVRVSTDPATPLGPGLGPEESTWKPADTAGFIFPPSEIKAGEIDPVFGVSCPTTSFCAAVDSYGYVAITTDPANPANGWVATEIDHGTPFEEISCPSVSLCVAVDEDGNVVASSEPQGGAGAWQVASVDPGHAITGISCPSVSLCVAVDDAGDVLVSTEPTGGAGAWSVTDVDHPHPETPVDAFSSVSCPSVSLCVAVDRAGYAVMGTAPEAPKGGPGEPGPGETNPGSGGPQGSQPGTGGGEGTGGGVTSGVFKIIRARVTSRGRIELRLEAPAAGSFDGSAVVPPTRTRAGGAGRGVARGRSRRAIAYGRALTAVRAADTTTLVIEPSRAALRALRRAQRLRLEVSVTFTPRGGRPSSRGLTLTVGR
ncbi:MAG TPA: hypothetical protein VG147_00765 [Solirubrobacteraceae bacterium]|jgi:hypothetical protein|nr:hypothetical protein [Solirubrobacteraceae bacterium]